MQEYFKRRNGFVKGIGPTMLAQFVVGTVLLLAVLVTAPAPSREDLTKLLRESKVKGGFTKYGFGENPEVNMNTTQLITSKGYPAENYKVVTEDGYILGLSRIPHGLHNKNLKGPRPVVLLQHGLVASADDWLVNSADESLAYILADAGADVWLGNSRGNVYSRQHKTLSPKHIDFWKFSWDEIAEYDLPAIIYYALNVTGAQQLFYVGHSQGTAIGFARFGEDHELASRVKHFMAMAPIARVSHTKSPLRLLVPFSAEVKLFLDIFGHGEFLIPRGLQRVLAGDLCQKWGEFICENGFFLLCGYDFKSLNASRMDVYLSHDPAGTSTRVLLQWAQGVHTGNFQHFDWGEKENMEKYGQKTPPLYNPKNVKVPVAIFRGGHDWLADKKDVAWLLPQLNVTHDILVPFYEHLDMTFGFDANIRMYKDLVKIVMET